MIKQLSGKAVLLVGTAIVFLTCVQPASAENTATVENLRRVIELQQAQLEAQQAQLDAQKKALDDLQSQVRAVASQQSATQTTVPSVKAMTLPPTRQPETQQPAPELVTRHSNTVPNNQRPTNRLSGKARHDLNSPTGTNVSYPKHAVTLEVPEANTNLSIGGFAEMQVIYDTNGSDNNEFDVFLIPTDPAPPQTLFNVNPSRLAVSSETYLGFGRINTLVAGDLNGKLATPDPRLREAYGEFINDDDDYSFLAGQTFSNMLDLKSVPETLDFAGPSGYWARRQPLVRFSKLFDHRFRLDLSAETPGNAVYPSTAESRTRWPDFVVAGAYDFGGYVDHIRVIGLIRDLVAQDTVTENTDSTLGWAVGLSSKINLPALGEKDNFKFGVQYGYGFGGQLKSGPVDAVFDPSGSNLNTLGVLSVYGGLQHWWTDEFRSNAVFGYVDVDNPAFLTGEEMDNNLYLAANLIWNYYSNWTVGAEYLYGRLENIDGSTGVANRVVLSSKFDF